MSDELPLTLRANALFEAGALADQHGDPDRMWALQEVSLALYRQLGDQCGIAAALNSLGNPERDLVRARALHEESLRLYREQGDTAGIAKVLVNLASDVAALGDYAQAQTLWDESLQLSRQLGDLTLMGYALINMGNAAVKQGDRIQATAYLKESLALFQQLQDRRLIANCFIDLANAAPHAQAARAARLWGAAERLHDLIGDVISPADRAVAEGYQAIARAALGDAGFAEAWAEGQAMTVDQGIAHALDDPGEAAEAILGIKSTMQVPMSQMENEKA
jgi:tetratricopeptide (TPR) repeat protein